MKCLIPILYIFLFACKNPDTSVAKRVLGKKRPVYHLIDSAGNMRPDTSAFYKLKCGLYINKAGIIGYPSIDKSMEEEEPRIVYLASVYSAERKHTVNGGLMDMNKVVDTATFKILGDCYFVDKNHVYNFRWMMDGGTISINWDADKTSFISLGAGIYARDRKHCFYRGRIIKYADCESFNVFNDTLYNRAFDKRHFYAHGLVMTTKEVKESGFDTLKINW